VVQKVFTHEAYDKFEWASQLASDATVRGQALRHVFDKSHSQNFNEHTSAEERLAHFDIIRPTVLYRLLLRMQMSPTSSAALAVLAHLQDLAQTYSNLASQGSVAGVSLGGLLERFILTFPEDVSRSVAGLVGGENPRQVSKNQQFTVIGEEGIETNITLHMLRGKELVSAGETRVRDRVKKSRIDIIGQLDPEMMY